MRKVAEKIKVSQWKEKREKRKEKDAHKTSTELEREEIVGRSPWRRLFEMSLTRGSISWSLEKSFDDREDQTRWWDLGNQMTK